MGILEGRVVAITGASNGIGREHALLFASEGGAIQRLAGWTVGDGITTDGDWTIDNIAAQLGAVRV